MPPLTLHAARRPHPASAYARQLHPAAADFRLPEQLPDGQEFALVLPDRQRRPVAYVSRTCLALGIHRRRNGEALILAPERVQFRDQAREMVRVEAECQVSGRRRLIGHAWQKGQDWRLLQAALAAITPLQVVRAVRS